MARQTKVYQVKFETAGFQQVAKQFDNLQKRIRNAATGVPNRFSENFRSANIKTRPRSESGRFVSASSPSLDAQLFSIEIKRLTQSIDRLNAPLQKVSRNLGTFIDDIRPKSEEEILSRQFDKETSGLSAQNRGLALAFRTAIKEQSLRIEKAVEKNVGAGNEGFNPIGIATGALSSVTRAILMPFEATLFGAFQGIGESLTADLSKGFMEKAQKSAGLSLKEVGEDIGQIVGDLTYKAVDETASLIRNLQLDPGANGLIQVEHSINNFLGEVYKSIAFQIPLVGAKAYRRIRLNKEAIGLTTQMAGKAIIEEPIPDWQKEQIRDPAKKSITLAVGGYNQDPNDFGKDYTAKILEPLMPDSAVVPVERQDMSKGLDPVFEKQFKHLIKGALQSPEIKKGLLGFIKQSNTFSNFSPAEKREFFGSGDIDTADDSTIVSLVEKLLTSQEYSIGKIIEQTFKGYGFDDIVVAAQALKYRQEFPDKPINIVGFSQGGFQAAGATELLQRMGVKNVKGVGIGTVFTGAEYSGDSENFMSFVGEDDYYYKGAKGVLDNIGKPEYMQTAPGEGQMHSLPMYVAGGEFKGALQSFLGNTATIASSDEYSRQDASLLYNISSEGAMQSILRTLLNAAGVEKFGNLDMSGYTFGSGDLAGGNDPFSGKPTYVGKIQKSTRQATNPKIKEYGQKYLELLGKLQEELKRKEFAVSMGEDYKPTGLISEFASIFPELQTLEMPDSPDSSAIQERMSSQPLTEKLVSKMVSERENVKRTFLSMFGAELPKDKDNNPLYSYFDPKEYETRANEHLGGFIGWLEGDDWWGQASDAEKEAMLPYIQFLKDLKEQVLQVGKTGMLDTKILQDAEDLLGVKLPKSLSDQIGTKRKNIDVNKKNFSESLQRRKKGTIAESNPELMAYVAMLNKDIEKYNEENPDNQRPLIDPTKARHLGSGMFGIAISQPQKSINGVPQKPTVYKTGKWNDDSITQAVRPVIGDDLFEVINPFKTYREAWGKERFELVDKNELESMKIASEAGLGPELRSYSDRHLEMEMVEGDTVAQVIKTGSPAQIENLLIEAGKLIRQLHEAGVTHGDMSPWNMMQTPSGMKAIDFGSAEPNAKQYRRIKDIERMIKYSKREVEEFKPGFGIDAEKLIRQGYTQIDRIRNIRRGGKVYNPNAVRPSPYSSEIVDPSDRIQEIQSGAEEARGQAAPIRNIRRGGKFYNPNAVRPSPYSSEIVDPSDRIQEIQSGAEEARGQAAPIRNIRRGGKFYNPNAVRPSPYSSEIVEAQPQPPRNIPIELAPNTPRPQQIPIEIPEQGFPDTTSIVDRQFQRVEELRQLARAFQPQRTGQTGLWNPDRPIPPGMVPDLIPASIRSLLADAQARFQQMRPSQLAANQEPQARFPISEELPQLIQAYQRSILEAFERSQEEMLRSLRDTIANLAQAPVESDQEGFSETIRSSLTEQARKLVRTYAQAINAIIGVSADPSTINQGNFGSEFEQLKEDTAAIMLRFREGIAQNFQETAALMQSLAQSYESESPAQLVGGKRQPYTEDFNEIIQNQLTEYQRNIRKLFADVAQSTAADFTDLRRLRAQLGLPAQAPKAGLSTRYNDRIQQLISGARTSAQERVRGLIPGFQELSPQQRSAELKKMRSQLTQGLAEFRSTMATGDQNAARQLGEGLLQRIEAIRAAYEDLGKNFTGDKRGIGAQKGQLTTQSKEIQARLKSIADNASGSLAAAIEADLGSVEGAGQSIGDALIEGTEDSLEISSPSQVFQRIGENVVQGFQQGLSNLANSFNVFNELNQDLPNVDPDIFNIFSDLSQAAQDEISGFDANVAEGLRMVQEQVESLIQQFPILNNLLQIGSRLGGSIALGMAAFSTIGFVFKQAGIGKFFDAIATLPDTSGEAGRELQSLSIAFESVTGSSALAADAMQYVSDTAEKFGINIRSAEEAYLGLVATTRGTELEGFQTQKIFEAFAQTAALRGLDQQQQQQMFVAVQQVLGKGKLSAEEVRGQLGEIPALAFQQTLASSLGVNLQQLDKLLSTGQLQSDALFKVAQAYESANAQMSGASEPPPLGPPEPRPRSDNNAPNCTPPRPSPGGPAAPGIRNRVPRDKTARAFYRCQRCPRRPAWARVSKAAAIQGSPPEPRCHPPGSAWKISRPSSAQRPAGNASRFFLSQGLFHGLGNSLSPQILRHHLSIGPDEPDRGNSPYPVLFGDLVLPPIPQEAVNPLGPLLFGVGNRLLFVLVQGKPDHYEVFPCSELFIHRLQIGRLPRARPTPCRPKIEQHVLPAVISQLDRLVIGRLDFKARRLLPHFRFRLGNRRTAPAGSRLGRHHPPPEDFGFFCIPNHAALSIKRAGLGFLGPLGNPIRAHQLHGIHLVPSTLSFRVEVEFDFFG